ncbi:MAG: DNA topoisomerase [Firmicutes bacterium]|nr:DNA topoisomerase [Bacillota bacterium]
MKLIIAEKPSLARNITSAIGGLSRRDGYFEGGEYIVTWAFGHLFSLADIEAYNPSPDGSGRWTMENLPCFPRKFIFELRRNEEKKPDSGVVNQFETIKKLINRQDVDTVINAGDSDREGEIIVRIIIDHALEAPEDREKKGFKRLWLPDQTAETINSALSDMKDESEYDNLAFEGYARTFIDWLYGVNLTRYATLKTGTLMRVGRVIVPIVHAIYDRDMAIRNFVPDIYYAVISSAETNGEKIELTSKTKFSKDELEKAKSYAQRLNSCGAVVTAVKKKKDKLNPGKLYSLTKLQNVLGKKYKMSMSDSLTAVQKLYEDGYVTYPRTNSEYLATAEKDKVKGILSVVAKLGYPVSFRDSKTIFDDSKIESHSALTPTVKIPPKGSLSPDCEKVYGAVIRRFVAVFCSQECLIERTEMKIGVGDIEEFTLKGNVILEKGWTKYDDYRSKDRFLPPLNKGDSVNIDFVPTEKETSPPKHYTIETLNNYLKNPFKEEKAQSAEQEDENQNDSEDYKAIFEGLELGTEATRTGIIDNARKSGYIELKKDVYYILPDGENLIESLKRMNIGMDKYKTVELGKSLKKVFRGECHINDSLTLAKREIAEVFSVKAVSMEDDTDDGFMGDVAGKCPLCGGDVVRTRFGYGCSNYKDGGCKFSVNRIICGRVISLSNMKMLLDVGRTTKIRGFVSKSGKTFDAALRLENGKAVFDFPQRN